VLAIVGALLLGGAVFYIIYTTQIAAQATAAEDRLNLDWSSEKATFDAPFYLKLTKPLLKGSYLEIAAGFWKPEQLDKWRRLLTSAGLGKYIQPEHFVAAKFWMAMMIGLFMILRQIFSSDAGGLMFPVGAVAFGFFYPNIHIKTLRDSRQQDIRLAMPYVVDLLSLSTEAGLDFMGAIAKVVDRAPMSPFVEELSTLLKDIQLGKTRAEALRSMATRIDMSEMSSFVAVLVSSDQMGASVGGVLRAQSESMRNERLVKAEKLGAQASQKILVPLAFFILPAVLLMIFAPMILGMLGVK